MRRSARQCRSTYARRDPKVRVCARTSRSTPCPVMTSPARPPFGSPSSLISIPVSSDHRLPCGRRLEAPGCRAARAGTGGGAQDHARTSSPDRSVALRRSVLSPPVAPASADREEACRSGARRQARRRGIEAVAPTSCLSRRTRPTTTCTAPRSSYHAAAALPRVSCRHGRRTFHSSRFRRRGSRSRSAPHPKMDHSSRCPGRSSRNLETRAASARHHLIYTHRPRPYDERGFCPLQHETTCAGGSDRRGLARLEGKGIRRCSGLARVPPPSPRTSHRAGLAARGARGRLGAGPRSGPAHWLGSRVRDQRARYSPVVATTSSGNAALSVASCRAIGGQGLST